MWALARRFREIPDSFEYSVCVYLSQQFRFAPVRDLFWRAAAGKALLMFSRAQTREHVGTRLMQIPRFDKVSVI